MATRGRNAPRTGSIGPLLWADRLGAKALRWKGKEGSSILRLALAHSRPAWWDGVLGKRNRSGERGPSRLIWTWVQSPSRYLGPISLRKWNSGWPSPPPPVWTLIYRVQGGHRAGIRGVSHYIITSWGQGAESEGRVGFSSRRNRNWPRAWKGLESCDHPLQECAPSSGASDSRESEREKSMGFAWIPSPPRTHTRPSHPNSCQSSEGLPCPLWPQPTTLAPKAAVSGGLPCLYFPQAPPSPLGPWVPWAGHIGEGHKEEPIGQLMSTSGLPDRARWGVLCGWAALGVGTGNYLGPGVLRLRTHPGSVTDLLGVLEQSPSWGFFFFFFKSAKGK